LAKGARVLATAGSDKIALLRELDVAEAIDYTATRFEDVARDIDVVFDTVAGELTERSWYVECDSAILGYAVMDWEQRAASPTSSYGFEPDS
jgi:predicted component of type VI protein secretion system